MIQSPEHIGNRLLCRCGRYEAIWSDMHVEDTEVLLGSQVEIRTLKEPATNASSSTNARSMLSQVEATRRFAWNDAYLQLLRCHAAFCNDIMSPYSTSQKDIR